MSFPLTNAHLQAGGVPPGLWARYLAPLNAAMTEFDITTGERPAMFLAQICEESENLRYTCEIWGPTAQQRKYDDGGPLSISLGDAPGEGQKYAGHGFIEITGKRNHMACAAHFGIDPNYIVAWLQGSEGACRSAAWFWNTHGCNALADKFDIVGVTKIINGGLNGLQQRTDLYKAISAV
jgi:putative chitinase